MATNWTFGWFVSVVFSRFPFAKCKQKKKHRDGEKEIKEKQTSKSNDLSNAHSTQPF